MQTARHERLGNHSAAVITIAKSHQVTTDELMHSMRELVDSGADFEPEHDGHHAAVEAAAAMPALTRITWPKRPASILELQAERQAKHQAAELERVKKKREARAAERKRKDDAAELAAAAAQAAADAAAEADDAELADEPEDAPATPSARKTRTSRKKTTKRKS